jgi:hypothetical protein
MIIYYRTFNTYIGQIMKLKKGIVIDNLSSENYNNITINSGVINNKDQITDRVDFNGLR